MLHTFTPDTVALCLLGARCKGGNELSLVARWRGAGLGFLVIKSGFGRLRSKVKELQQVITIRDVSMLLAIA